MQYQTAEGSQGLCPPGSHEPTDSVWSTLISYDFSIEYDYNVAKKIYLCIMTKQAINILAEIKKTVVSIDPGAQIFLFGSRARANFRPDSDWDILILLNKPQVDYQERKQIRKKLYKIELSTGQPISAFVYSSGEWINNQSDTPLFDSVRSEGIRL